MLRSRKNRGVMAPIRSGVAAERSSCDLRSRREPRRRDPSSCQQCEKLGPLDQRLSLEQAIEGYTLGAAYSVHREHEEGSIKPGKLADLIILNQNLFAIDPRKIAETQVLMTIVGGKIVYQSPAWPQASAAKKGQVAP